VSCDRPECNNSNSIFDTNAPNSEIYKAELAKQLKLIDTSNLRYWLQKYENDQDVESLYFYVQSDELCAVMHMSMTHWTQLHRLRQKQGVGRRGAEFVNLQYDIVINKDNTQFFYNRFDRMID
jgi:hypothetical protein